MHHKDAMRILDQVDKGAILLLLPARYQTLNMYFIADQSLIICAPPKHSPQPKKRYQLKFSSPLQPEPLGRHAAKRILGHHEGSITIFP